MFIYLVRHGQSLWNAEDRHQGWQEVALSPLGEQQAVRIGQRLKEQRFDYHFTSPIYRCYQTAAAIVKEQGLEPEQALAALENLREGRISASMEGMLTKDMFKSWTAEQKRLFRDDYSFKFDDGESVQEVLARTLAAFNQIALLSEEAPSEPEETEGQPKRDGPGADSITEQPAASEPEKPKIVPKTALVVTHRLNAQLMTLHALDATEAVVRRQTNIDRLEISNCALTVIEVNLKGKQPLFRLVSCNDTGHLAGIKPPDAIEPPLQAAGG